jgi:hypothetical protein
LSGDRSAARVAGRPIRLSDVEERASRLRNEPTAWHLGPARGAADDWVVRWAVRQLVGEAVMNHVIRGEPGLIGGPEDAIRRLVHRVTGPIRISEQDVRRYYERNADLYRIPERRRVSYIALGDRRDAVRAGRRLIAHGAQASSADRCAEMELQRGAYVGALEAAVFAARIGDLVGPLRTEHGWLVARVDAITPAAAVPYEVARPAIAHQLLEVARTRAFDDWLELRRLELARIAPDYEHPAHPLHGQPRHRH